MLNALSYWSDWIMILARIKFNKTDNYERGPFSIFSLGVLISVFSIVWFMLNRQVFISYLL